MKKVALLSLLIVSALLGFESAALGELTRVAEGVYSYLDVKEGGPANSFAANAGIVVGRDGMVVIDTLVSAREAERFLKDIRRVSDKPVLYVIDTHHHLDHAFGNALFAGMGAVVVSHDKSRAEMIAHAGETLKNAAGYGLTPEQMEGTDIVYPSLTFSDRMTIHLGDREVELIYLGPSHTSGSIVVRVPDCKVLFVGDILFTDYHPYLAEGDIPGWTASLDRIMEMDAERIVPGHGPLSGKKEIADLKAYLTLFDKKARELASQGGDAAAAAAVLKKLLPAKSQGEWMIAYNLRMRYFKGR